jgi:Fic family protein
MGSTYIWELGSWPRFHYRVEELLPALSRTRRAQGELLGKVEIIGLPSKSEAALDAMSREVVSNSAIEGVDLSLEAVRASMMLRLGAHTGGLQTPAARRVDPIVGVLTEAVKGFADALGLRRMFGWHRALFPGGYSPQVGEIRVGGFRAEEPMVVATPSRSLAQPDIIHFQAPGRERLDGEMKAFLGWFNRPPAGLDGLIRAGLAHLWFVTIHPFEDGNGRIARTITDLALAQDEASPYRFYSLSAQILRNREGYYAALEAAQRGTLDVTAWLGWFLGEAEGAIRHGIEEVHRVTARNLFWSRAERLPLNDRQVRALKWLLSPAAGAEHITNRFYRSFTDSNRTTALRDLTSLVDLGLLESGRGGRSTSYRVPLERFLPGSLSSFVQGKAAGDPRRK